MATPSKSSKGSTRRARQSRQAPPRAINFGLILAGLAAVLVIAGLALVGTLAGGGTSTANPTNPTPSSSVAIVRAGTPAPFGTPILASAGGRVRYAGPRGAYGRTVEIDHGDGLVTRYGHVSRILVRVGDVLLPGQPVAYVGSTGRSNGPHVHFEVLRDGVPVHPGLYLANDGA